VASPLRLGFADAIYHGSPRGDQRKLIYESGRDRTLFLATTGKVCD